MFPAMPAVKVVIFAIHNDVCDRSLWIDLFVDAGYCALEPTTLLDLTGEHPVVLRQGAGVVDF